MNVGVRRSLLLDATAEVEEEEVWRSAVRRLVRQNEAMIAESVMCEAVEDMEGVEKIVNDGVNWSCNFSSKAKNADRNRPSAHGPSSNLLLYTT